MTPASRTGRLWRMAAVLLAAAGLVGAVWLWVAGPAGQAPVEDEPRPDPPPPDPRLVFDTPHRNVRPEVRYVGDAACADCHAEIVRSYSAHPMARSAEWVGSAAGEAHLGAANNPLTSGVFELRAERVAGRVRHVMSAPGVAGGTLPPYSVSADLAIGSGRQGKSYLTIDRGAAWQSPLSWFRPGDRLDVSPGFELGAAARRPVGGGCLFCHTDPVRPVEQSLNRYHEPLFRFRPGIGCERCHGPGELHVAERSAGDTPAGPDHSIVNPARLAADLRADVCRQCHLQGKVRVERRGRDPFEYRPGLPWEQFVSVFVAHPDLADARRSVGQFEQMEQSRCYLGSGGRMSCTTCHDPHSAPAPSAAAAHYRARCLSCHETHGCSAPAAERRAREDNCVACHMAARDSSNIVHAAVTDHRVPRRPGSDSAPPGKALAPDQPPLVPYPAGPHAPPPEERERDWAVALGREAAKTAASGAARPELARLARARLDAALARWPGDAVCWSASAGLLLARGGGAEALKAARRAAALAPGSESALGRLAEAAGEAGEYELMAETGRRLASANPSSADYRATTATALVCLKRWEEAEAEARAALAIHPLHPNARLLLAVCLDRRGDPRAGRGELDVALRLAPTPRSRSVMSEWYLRQIR